MAGDPYCGRCHTFMSPSFTGPNAADIIWVCECPMGQADITKDPNCHNSGHDHHDPESPIVLARQAEYAAEEEDVESREPKIMPLPLRADTHCPACADGIPCPALAELDEILEETKNEYCLLYGHNWVRVGTIKTASVLTSVDWGPPMCLRCGEPGPEEEGFVFREGPTDRPGGEFEEVDVMAQMLGEDEEEPVPCLVHSGIITPDGLICDRCGHNMHEIQPYPPERKLEPKHACPGCNLRDLTMRDAKKHISKLLGLVGTIMQRPKRFWPTDRDTVRREAAAFLRMTGKIRAMKED